MTKLQATIEIFHKGVWRPAAVFTPSAKHLALGYKGNASIDYDLDYAYESTAEEPLPNIAFNYPVSFGSYDTPSWPAFMLDIIPTGAGRRVWLRRLRRTDGPEADWALLLQGAGNPPGNLRIAEAAMKPAKPHPGFTRDEIIEKNADFIEYAEEHGAIMAGATDVQGDAPKYLLARDRKGRWHPDGSLPDAEVMDSWLVKFPRGKTERDRLVLRNEAPYLEVARWFGLKVGAPLEYTDDSLFVPRFDRARVDGRFQRYGLETVCSAAEVAEFGKRGDHLVFCRAIAAASSDTNADILEYVRRDILNAALRNTDNHGRNTALLKAQGQATLSPVYDFAPMFLDPDGIPRASRWPEKLEPIIGRPDWGSIGMALAGFCKAIDLQEAFAADSDTVRRLPDTMKQCKVEDEVINGVARRCEEIADDLLEAGRR
jgi:serine/threonine-protein kinase HipA